MNPGSARLPATRPVVQGLDSALFPGARPSVPRGTPGDLIPHCYPQGPPGGLSGEVDGGGAGGEVCLELPILGGQIRAAEGVAVGRAVGGVAVSGDGDGALLGERAAVQGNDASGAGAVELSRVDQHVVVHPDGLVVAAP